MTRISSQKYRDGARDQTCTLRIRGVCTGGGEDTVFAHIRDRHAGGAMKASDTSGADACRACHDVFDRRAKMPDGFLISDEDWHYYALRGLQETIERRIGQGLLSLPVDAAETRRTSKQKPKPIKQRANAWPPRGSRKIQQRVK